MSERWVRVWREKVGGEATMDLDVGRLWRVYCDEGGAGSHGSTPSTSDAWAGYDVASDCVRDTVGGGLVLGVSGVLFGWALHRVATAKWSPERMAKHLPPLAVVETLCCLALAVTRPFLLLWDGGVMQRPLALYRWATAFPAAVAWLLHARCLRTRSPADLRLALLALWGASFGAALWAGVAAVATHDTRRGGHAWAGDTEARLVVAALEVALTATLAGTALARPPAPLNRERRMRRLRRQALRAQQQAGERGGGRGESSEALLLIDRDRDQDPDASTDEDSRRGDQGAGQKPKLPWYRFARQVAGFVWPRQLGVQMHLLACFVLLLAARVLTLLLPLTYKWMIDELAEITSARAAGGPGDSAGFAEAVAKVWPYMLALFLMGGGGGVSGILSNIRSALWIKVQQETTKRCSVAVFDHLLHLSAAFHVNRKTGEVLRIIDRGTSSLSSVLSAVVFNLAPTFFDIAVACIFFAAEFEVSIVVLVATTMATYIPMTVMITEWRSEFRRDMNKLDNARSHRASDALLNHETVLLFGNEAYEANRFEAAIVAYQAKEWETLITLALLNVAQSIVLIAGISAGLALITLRVTEGQMGVGDAALFLVYVQQLSAPLNWFGTYYRMLQQYIIDTENMFELLETASAVADDPQALELPVFTHGCDVTFEDVHFSYETPQKATPSGAVQRSGEDGDGAETVSHATLNGLSFTAEAGKTLALVGSTGSGKTTVLRLLLRLYDPGQGRIMIGGRDIRSMTQASLRANLGTVPQDCVLFNETLMENVRYGRLEATDADVRAASERAALDPDAKFPKGYDTVVGERGLRLSGGEKQRVGLARTLLKDAPVLLLDEATSSLDSLTEREVQESLEAAGRGRTVIVVAHRLSTVRNADRILVIDKGRVSEQGSHAELLEQGGAYAAMWHTQTSEHAPATDDAG